MIETSATLTGKAVIVTGGAQGIGRGICRHLLAMGMRVVAADLDADAGTDLLRRLANPESLAHVSADVADEESVAGAIKQTVERFGRLDALVNNAGIAAPGRTPVEALSLKDWNRVIATNLTGSFLCAKHAAPHLRAQGGSIVNIASTRALQSEANTEAYSASKGGVVALTHALAVSLGPEIRVNCISPGWIEVSEWQKPGRHREPDLRAIDHLQHPAGRVGRPDDIAAMVAFLISDEAGFITGQNFVVDGGMSRRMIYAE